MSASVPPPPESTPPNPPESIPAPDDSEPRAGEKSRRDRTISIGPRGDRPAPLVFKQGANAPYGIRWYGLTSLYGHWRSFVSRAIAVESVDTRDWMKPNDPAQLVASMARVLGGHPSAPSLTEALGRPVYIDFVADTGDDRDVSAAVGAMIARPYEIDGRVLPRGDVLVFGGDVSYPVATAEEIYRRLVLPWNETLRRIGASEGRRRVLLGVPGNHDWYDGLDGFGRLFRRRVDEPFRADVTDQQPKLIQRLARGKKRPLGLVARGLHFDEIGTFFSIVVRMGKAVRAFFRGVSLKRRRRLSLKGYEPVQEASYFALPLAPGLEMWGADRQLGRVDFRQRAFFKSRRSVNPDARLLFIAADPAIAYGLRNDPGARMLAACTLDFEHDKVFYLTGDYHHYERRAVGESLHVIAGGGGAFLHGTRISPYPVAYGPPACVYPTGEMSRKLALQVPWKLLLGRSGFVPHNFAGVLAVAQIALAPRSSTAAIVASAVGSSLVTLVLFLIAGHQGGVHSGRVLRFAAPFGLVIGMLPMLLRQGIEGRIPALAANTAIVVLCAFVGALLYGTFLMTMAMLGFEHQQAFTVLGHPGFKHFVRLCVHPDGRIEAFTIGKDDMLAKEKPSVIDTFSW